MLQHSLSWIVAIRAPKSQDSYSWLSYHWLFEHCQSNLRIHTSSNRAFSFPTPYIFLHGYASNLVNITLAGTWICMPPNMVYCFKAFDPSTHFRSSPSPMLCRLVKFQPSMLKSCTVHRGPDLCLKANLRALSLRRVHGWNSLSWSLGVSRRNESEAIKLCRSPSPPQEASRCVEMSSTQEPGTLLLRRHQDKEDTAIQSEPSKMPLSNAIVLAYNNLQ